MTTEAQLAAWYPELYRPGRFYLIGDRILAPMGWRHIRLPGDPEDDPYGALKTWPMSCGRLPFPLPPDRPAFAQLSPCGRPWTPIDLVRLVAYRQCPLPGCRDWGFYCPLSDRIVSIAAEAEQAYPAGLVWLPTAQWPNPYNWEPAVEQCGVRWPLRYLPETCTPRPGMIVLVAHLHALVNVQQIGPETTPAICYAFRIGRIEYIRRDGQVVQHDARPPGTPGVQRNHLTGAQS